MLLSSSRLLILALFCVASIGCGSAQNSEAFKEVDKLLRQKGEQEMPVVYLDAVDAKLKELKKELADEKPATRDFFEALEMVSAYRQVLDEKTCEFDEVFLVLEPVADNSDARQGSNHLSGLDWLVYSVGLDHANYCKDKYPALFGKIYSQLDENVKLHAEFKIHRFEELEKTMDHKEFVEYLIDYKKDPNIASDASKNLLGLSKDEKCDFEQIYSKYLLDPCLDYYSEVGQIVVPMKYDASFFTGKSFFDMEDKSLLSLYKAMAQTEACSTIVTSGDLKEQVRIEVEQHNSKDCSGRSPSPEDEINPPHWQQQYLFDMQAE